MNLNDKTAVQLKEYRESRNISQAAFAKSISLSNSAYCRLENGEIQITLNVLEKIIENYDITLYELLGIKPAQINNFNNNQLCPIHNGVLNINLGADDITDVLELLRKKNS